MHAEPRQKLQRAPGEEYLADPKARITEMMHVLVINNLTSLKALPFFTFLPFSFSFSM